MITMWLRYTRLQMNRKILFKYLIYANNCTIFISYCLLWNSEILYKKVFNHVTYMHTISQSCLYYKSAYCLDHLFFFTIDISYVASGNIKMMFCRFPGQYSQTNFLRVKYKLSKFVQVMVFKYIKKRFYPGPYQEFFCWVSVSNLITVL